MTVCKDLSEVAITYPVRGLVQITRNKTSQLVTQAPGSVAANNWSATPHTACEMHRQHLACLSSAIITLISASTYPSTQRDFDLQRARDIFSVAMEYKAAGKFSRCIDSLEQVLAIKDTAGVRYQLGYCQANAGRLRNAWVSYRASKLLAESNHVEDVLSVVSTAIHDLEKRIPTLYVPNNGQLEYEINGISPSTNPTRLDPGLHKVVFRWPSGAVTEKSIKLKEFDREIAVATQPIVITRKLPVVSSKPAQQSLAQPVLIGASIGSMIVAASSYWWLSKLEDDRDVSCTQGVVCDPQRERDIHKYQALIVTALLTSAGLLGASWWVAK